jgi:hypothetical protein
MSGAPSIRFAVDVSKVILPSWVLHNGYFARDVREFTVTNATNRPLRLAGRTPCRSQERITQSAAPPFEKCSRSQKRSTSSWRRQARKARAENDSTVRSNRVKLAFQLRREERVKPLRKSDNIALSLWTLRKPQLGSPRAAITRRKLQLAQLELHALRKFSNSGGDWRLSVGRGSPPLPR